MTVEKPRLVRGFLMRAHMAQAQAVRARRSYTRACTSQAQAGRVSRPKAMP